MASYLYVYTVEPFCAGACSFLALLVGRWRWPPDVPELGAGWGGCLAAGKVKMAAARGFSGAATSARSRSSRLISRWRLTFRGTLAGRGGSPRSVRDGTA